MLIGSLGVSFIILVVLLWPKDEPEFNGKTLSEWLADVESPSYFSRTNPDEVEFLSPAAKEAIIGMGTNTLPHLVNMLTHQDSVLKLKILALAKKQSWVPIRVVPASECRSRALKALELLGSIAEPMAPDLIILMQDSDERVTYAALSALEIFDPASRRRWLPVLTPLVDHKKPHVRNAARQLLSGQ